MGSSAFGQLRTSLAEYLAEIWSSTKQGDDRAVAVLARKALPRLVEALNAVLDEHSPDADGRCASCRSRRFGRTPRPCRAYLSAHLCLLPAADEPEPVPVAPQPRRSVVVAEPARRSVLRTPS
ncbi:hypothetical protein [Actinophytocola xanthii]|uniref:Uncharacterized protein n=1 Tax=Actinophytocola xanthii TaxID=1912961 RepID=A0A1Q8CP89_9PSEU|nr:hypothetical protein [Actinophytocola xanthii]OLF16151.1 hypothetical protein BU204_18565 [Actinophytocola xanthii]